MTKPSRSGELQHLSLLSIWIGLVWASLVLGCGAVHLERSEWKERIPSNFEPAAVSTLPDAPPEVDVSALRGELRAGSFLVYAIERDLESGETEKWWLTIAGPAEGGPPKSQVRCTMHMDVDKDWLLGIVSGVYDGRLQLQDQQGNTSQGQVDLPITLLSQGFFSVCEICNANLSETELESGEQESNDEAFNNAMGASTCCSQAIMAIGLGNSGVRKLIMRLIQYPSWWKWLVPTLDGSFSVDGFGAQSTSTYLGRAWIVPVEYKFKGDPAFYAKMVVVPPAGALKMTGGILSGAGFAPNRPTEEVRWFLERASFQDSQKPGPEIPTQ